MRVIQVVPSIREEASGPSYSVTSLCRAVAGCEVDVSLHVLAPAGVMTGCPFEMHAHPRWKFLHRLGISPGMRKALQDEAEGAEIIHGHSLWMMPNVYPAWAARSGGSRLVTSPRGTLSPVARRRSWAWKRLMWIALQRKAIQESACLHATSKAELTDIRHAGLRAPVAVIPNGIDLPDLTAGPPSGGRLRRALFLGRIHPIKGIDILLRAWSRVQWRQPDWELHIVGPDREGTLAKMEALAASLRLERVTFRGPAYGERKTEAYRQADLFILPSLSENFGVTVAEALAHGLPAIVSRGAPWSGLEDHRCGWWVDQGEGPLTECLETALALGPEELRDRGRRGRAWMEQDFAWPQIGRMMTVTYKWLLGGGPPPDWVSV